MTVSGHPLEIAKARRRALAGRPNPRLGLDYLAEIETAMAAGGDGGRVGVRVRYVPDDYLLAPDCLRRYLADLEAAGAAGLEELGALLIGDIDSEILPRWIQVRLSAQGEDGAHAVVLEQRKPGWSNAMLLARLRID